MKTVTARDSITGENFRIKIGEKMLNERGNEIHDNRYSTGVSLIGVYMGKKWFVMEFYSSWDNGKGCCTGTTYTAYDMTDARNESHLLSIWGDLDIEPPASFEAVEA